MGFPKTGYYGSQVTIGGTTCGTTEDLQGKEFATVYFSDAVDFNAFELKDAATLDVVYHAACP